MLLPRVPESAAGGVSFRIAPRLTEHVRHRQKYVDVPVADRLAFEFTDHGQPTGRRGRTLTEFWSNATPVPYPRWARILIEVTSRAGSAKSLAITPWRAASAISSSSIDWVSRSTSWTPCATWSTPATRSSTTSSPHKRCVSLARRRSFAWPHRHRAVESALSGAGRARTGRARAQVLTRWQFRVNTKEICRSNTAAHLSS
jgi:hypothetical protein